jgi:hypothetical protein
MVNIDGASWTPLAYFVGPLIYQRDWHNDKGMHLSDQASCLDEGARLHCFAEPHVIS